MEVKKIRASGKEKIVTIPKKSDLQIGDYVRIEKIKDKEDDKLHE